MPGKKEKFFSAGGRNRDRGGEENSEKSPSGQVFAKAHGKTDVSGGQEEKKKATFVFLRLERVL